MKFLNEIGNEKLFRPMGYVQFSSAHAQIRGVVREAFKRLMYYL
jgi:hypothetical protein